MQGNAINLQDIVFCWVQALVIRENEAQVLELVPKTCLERSLLASVFLIKEASK